MYLEGLRHTTCVEDKPEHKPETIRLYIELFIQLSDIVRDFLPHEQILIQEKYRVETEYLIYFPSRSC